MKALFFLFLIIAGSAVYYLYFKPVPPPPPQVKPAPPKEERVNYAELISKYEAEAKSGNQVAQVICKFANHQLKEYDDGEKFVITQADPESGKDILEKISTSKHPFYMFIKGYCLYYGIGTEQDYDSAVNLFKESRSLEYSEAAYAVSLIHGKGIPQNKEEGLQRLLDLAKCRYNQPSGEWRVSSDCFYSTSRFLPSPGSAKYAPAGIILGNIYTEENVYEKATQAYLNSYISGMKSVLPKLSELFAIMLKDASECWKKSIEEFENSPDFQKRISEFQKEQKEKNKMLLESVPDFIANETKLFKDQLTKSQKSKILREYFSSKGWILYDNGQKGIPLDMFKHDMYTGINLASEYLQNYYRLNRKFPDGFYENATAVADKLKELSKIAKETESVASDYYGIRAFQLILSTKLEPNLSGKTSAELNKIAEQLHEKNSLRPNPITLITEKYVLHHQSDMLAPEIEKVNADINQLEASAKIKTFEYKRGEDKLFNKKKPTSENNSEDSDEKKKGKLKLKINPVAVSSAGTLKSGNQTTYIVVINDTQSEIVSTAEFNNLKKQFDDYTKEKERLKSLKDAKLKRNSSINAVISSNNNLLYALFNKKASKVTENFKGFSKPEEDSNN